MCRAHPIGIRSRSLDGSIRGVGAGAWSARICEDRAAHADTEPGRALPTVLPV